jgi:hypothetical protein
MLHRLMTGKNHLHRKKTRATLVTLCRSPFAEPQYHKAINVRKVKTAPPAFPETGTVSIIDITRATWQHPLLAGLINTSAPL